MSFEHAPVSKGLMAGVALSSILVGIFDVKHYFHLQLVPHISRHYQYWRLGVHHLAFASSSELFIAELLLYNIAVQVERQFGTLKFASFAVISTLLATLLEFLSLLLLHRAGLNHLPAGPSTLLFSIIYQYSRIVPSAYDFRVFGLPLTNKSFTYVLALQLALSHPPGSLASALLGILAGQIYRSDLAALKTYRIPPRLAAFASAYLLPLLGSLRPTRRSNRALPDGGAPTDAANANDDSGNDNDEVVTTARAPPAGAGSNTGSGAENAGSGATGSSVMREWVAGLTGRAGASGGATTAAGRSIRVPTEPEIAQLASMFPGVQREVLVGTLQRSPNIESAVEALLSSSSQ